MFGLQCLPRESEHLTSEELVFVKEWIAACTCGLPEQRLVENSAGVRSVGTGDEIRVATSGGLSEEWSNRTYQPAPFKRISRLLMSTLLRFRGTRLITWLRSICQWD